MLRNAIQAACRVTMYLCLDVETKYLYFDRGRGVNELSAFVFMNIVGYRTDWESIFCFQKDRGLSFYRRDAFSLCFQRDRGLYLHLRYGFVLDIGRSSAEAALRVRWEPAKYICGFEPPLRVRFLRSRERGLSRSAGLQLQGRFELVSRATNVLPLPIGVRSIPLGYHGILLKSIEIFRDYALDTRFAPVLRCLCDRAIQLCDGFLDVLVALAEQVRHGLFARHVLRMLLNLFGHKVISWKT